MPEFEVKVQSLQNISSRQAQLAGQLNECAAETENILRGLTMQIRQRERIDSRLREMKTSMERQSRAVSNLARTGEAIAALYQKTEDENSQQNLWNDWGLRMVEIDPSIFNLLFGGSGGTGGNYTFFDYVKDRWGNLTPSQKNLLKDLTEIGISAAVGQGAVIGTLISAVTDPNKFTGIKDATQWKVSGEYKGDLNGIEYGVSGSAQMWKNDTKLKFNSTIGPGKDKDNNDDWNKFNVSAGVEGSASGSIFDASGKANFGIASGSAGVGIGNAAVAGSFGASLFKEGRLYPSLDAKLRAEASAVQGKVDGQLGSDTMNVHGEAKGWLGQAEAEAKANLGANGLELAAGAEACAAKGELSGGFTIAGIKVDASFVGKAGAIGGKAKAKIGHDGIAGDIGASLGLGIGLKVKIDWSNCRFFPWAKH